MKLRELLNGIETKTDYVQNPEITMVTDDSRKVRNSSAFICIEGSEHDGHDFAHRALEKGASVVICERDLGIKNSIIVENTREAYALLCANFYGNRHRQMKLIGITGTNGKTTTSFILKRILEENGYKVGVIGTLGAVIGAEQYPLEHTTPNPSILHRLFYMMWLAGCDVCVMEVSSQALAKQRLYGVEFDIGIFTNLTAEHLDYHKDMESYALAKAKLMQNSRICVINADDPYADFMKQNAGGEILTYAIDGKADITAEEITLSRNGVDYTLKTQGVSLRVDYGSVGKFSVYNSMAALAAAQLMSLNTDRCLKGVAEAQTVKGRMEKVPNKRGINIFIDFAHTPDSLENALKTLKKLYSGRLIVVFGCGGDRDKSKRPIMGKIAASYADTVYVTSDNPRTEEPDEIIDDIVSELDEGSYIRQRDRAEAINEAVCEAKTGDTVLIAGKGHEKYQIIKTEKLRFDEREIIRKILDNEAN